MHDVNDQFPDRFTNFKLDDEIRFTIRYKVFAKVAFDGLACTY